MIGSITEVSLIAVITIVAIREVAQAAYDFLHWPRWLVRWLDRAKIAEVQRVLDQLGIDDDLKSSFAETRTRRRLRRHNVYGADDATNRAMSLVKRAFTTSPVSVGQTYGFDLPYFVDVFSESLKPGYAEEAAMVMVSHMKHVDGVPDGGFAQVVGLKEGSPLLAVHAAARLQVPLSLYRGRDLKPVGAPGDRRFDGRVTDRPALIVDDSSTGGRKVLECIEALKDLGASVPVVLVLFEPIGKQARARIEQAGSRFIAVVPMSKPTVAKLGSS